MKKCISKFQTQFAVTLMLVKHLRICYLEESETDVASSVHKKQTHHNLFKEIMLTTHGTDLNT